MKYLITCALPYVNNTPHLGNLIQVLSADCFAKYCKIKEREYIYICGTDEYGTTSEIKALQENISPKQLCDKYHQIHKEAYDFFNIDFSYFGRTSSQKQVEIVQEIFLDCYKNGYFKIKESKQYYSEKDNKFYSDRYVEGTCPKCNNIARGDQCEECNSLIEAETLLNPYSTVTKEALILKTTKHLYLDLPALQDKIKDFINTNAKKGEWNLNALQSAFAYIDNGLIERSMSRDLSWGIPIPYKYKGEEIAELKELKDKVFYVWFDAPIGYISITAELKEDWKAWWQYNPKLEQEVFLYQFIGKDNLMFHTITFPGVLIASEDNKDYNWTKLFKMSSTEFLNYRGGKFSKSHNTGIFSDDAIKTGIQADLWRFYLLYNRPEKSDYSFEWDDFLSIINKELIGNFLNLVNRTIKFYLKFLSNEPLVIEFDEFREFLIEYKADIKEVDNLLNEVELKKALFKILNISSKANKLFQEQEPWKLINQDKKKTLALVSLLIYLIKDLTIFLYPYIPQASKKIFQYLNLKENNILVKNVLNFSLKIEITEYQAIYNNLDPKEIEKLKESFQSSKEEKEDSKISSKAKKALKEDENLSLEERFNKRVLLKVCKIKDVKDHPNADTLYILDLDEGDKDRTIVSGLKDHYKKEDLIGKNILVVSNLKPSNFRQVKSNGMLLAASKDDIVEVLFTDQEQGSLIEINNQKRENTDLKQIDIDTFFTIPLRVENNILKVGKANLAVNNIEIKSKILKDANVG